MFACVSGDTVWNAYYSTPSDECSPSLVAFRNTLSSMLNIQYITKVPKDDVDSSEKVGAIIKALIC